MRHKITELNIRQLLIRPAFSFTSVLAVWLAILVFVMQVSSERALKENYLTGVIGVMPLEQHEIIERDQISGRIHWISRPRQFEIYLHLTPDAPVVVQFGGLGGN